MLPNVAWGGVNKSFSVDAAHGKSDTVRLSLQMEGSGNFDCHANKQKSTLELLVQLILIQNPVTLSFAL